MDFSRDRMITASDIVNLCHGGVVVYRRKDANTLRNLAARVGGNPTLLVKCGFQPDAPDKDLFGHEVSKCKDCNYCHHFIRVSPDGKMTTIGRWCLSMGMAVTANGTCVRACNKTGPVMICIGDNVNGMNRVGGYSDIDDLASRITTGQFSYQKVEDKKLSTDVDKNVDNSVDKSMNKISTGSYEQGRDSVGNEKVETQDVVENRK